MDPIKKLRSDLGRGISRAWEGLTEGWREVLTRSSGALTQYVRAAKQGGDGCQTKTSRQGLSWVGNAGKPPSRPSFASSRPGCGRKKLMLQLIIGRFRSR